MKKGSDFDLDVLRTLETLTREAAVAVAVGLIEASTTRSDRKAHLLRDLRSTKSAVAVSRIMWNVYLAGTGFSTVDSPWQKFHGAAA